MILIVIKMFNANILGLSFELFAIFFSLFGGYDLDLSVCFLIDCIQILMLNVVLGELLYLFRKSNFSPEFILHRK